MGSVTLRESVVRTQTTEQKYNAVEIMRQTQQQLNFEMVAEYALRRD
jgi:hypothetical protein